MIIGSNILFFKDLSSTNSHASLLLKNNRLTEGTIIYTNYQSAGKGYAGNIWESEDGKNLLMSIVLYPSFIKPSDQFCISMSISLGICDFIRRFIPDCSIKWPNDIYINNDKIAGILIENTIIADHIEYSIVGIGLNVNQIKFISSASNPVSLRQITSKTYDLQSCLAELTKDLDIRYKQLIAGKIESVNKEYITNLYRLNEWSRFRDANGEFTGRILALGDYGTLLIENEDKKIRGYAFKEVEFIQQFDPIL
jgi:BirA family transcriptional regulator, biotin operon repressor / biotin---[acetyl-CoA-carboxylase] ligase